MESLGDYTTKPRLSTVGWTDPIVLICSIVPCEVTIDIISIYLSKCEMAIT